MVRDGGSVQLGDIAVWDVPEVPVVCGTCKRVDLGAEDTLAAEGLEAEAEAADAAEQLDEVEVACACAAGIAGR